MGWLHCFISTYNFFYDEKCESFKNYKFNWSHTICGIWDYASNFLANNYHQWIYFNAKHVLPKSKKKSKLLILKPISLLQNKTFLQC